MNKRTVRYLSKGELKEANRRAIQSGGRAVEPEYIERLPDAFRYPVFFELPWERHGWVRCEIGTGTSPSADDYTPVWVDVPALIYDHLGTVEVAVDEETKP